MFMTTSILLGLLSAFTAAHAAPTDMAKRGNAPEIKVILQGAKVTRVFEQSKTPEYSGKESEGWGNDKERTVPAFTGGKYAMYLTLDVGGPMLYRCVIHSNTAQSKPETFKIQGDKLKAFDFSDQIVDGKLRLPSFKVKEGNTNGSKEVSMECIRKTEGVL